MEKFAYVAVEKELKLPVGLPLNVIMPFLQDGPALLTDHSRTFGLQKLMIVDHIYVGLVAFTTASSAEQNHSHFCRTICPAPYKYTYNKLRNLGDEIMKRDNTPYKYVGLGLVGLRS